MNKPLLSILQSHAQALTIHRGIEKESLRVSPEGFIAQTPHPDALGSALTHPFITTDYSEALLEFITPPESSITATLEHLHNHHRYTVSHMGSELLWPTSMPCMMCQDSDSIPVAQYGRSNIGQMKTIYRLGLGHRYGRVMQTIAGVHYNFSIDDDTWRLLREATHSPLSLSVFKTQGYLNLIRNFRRNFWLLLYLYGSAPAICKSFVGQRPHKLQVFGDDTHTLHAPFGTSLRMGDLGYQSNAQEQLFVDYNCLEDYLTTLSCAITKSHAAYEAIGLKDANGAYQQLNTGLLQIENEFYSVIRPKRPAQSGETALTALIRGGIEYIEVRCLDVNPFEPLGISREQIVFLDTFLLHCLLSPSPPTDIQEYRGIQHNQRQTVYQGRDPQTVLYDKNRLRPLRSWGQQLMDEMKPVARLLGGGDGEHEQVLEGACQALGDDQHTLSSRVLKEMVEGDMTFFQFAMAKAQEHKATFEHCEDISLKYQQIAKDSLQEQALIEQNDQLSFEDYLKQYYQQYRLCQDAQLPCA